MSEDNIWDSYGRWDEFARLDKLGSVKAKITGNSLWRPNFVSPAVAHIMAYAVDEMLSSESRSVPTAIDFGCGLGRNGPMLRGYFPRVVGVDLPEMVERVKSELPLLLNRTYGNIYSSAAEAASSEDCCLLYDSVALQHIVSHDYLFDLIDTLSIKPTFRTIVSLYYASGMDSAHLEVLSQRGWKIWYSEPDILSFEGIPHKITAFRRG